MYVVANYAPMVGFDTYTGAMIKIRIHDMQANPIYWWHECKRFQTLQLSDTQFWNFINQKSHTFTIPASSITKLSCLKISDTPPRDEKYEECNYPAGL